VHIRTSNMSRLARRLASLLALLWLATVPASSHAAEEPAYITVKSFPEFEIRQYPAYTVAEVVVPGPAGDAGNRAFPILAGYIFGKNKGERKFAMTAPVTQTPASARMAMTAPVTQSAAAAGILVQFILPKNIDLASAPEPLDPGVMLRHIPSRKLAAIRYSGLWSEANYNKHLAMLQDAMRTAGVAWKGEPVLSRYDSPMTPWFMRRNEIWLSVD
jgi:hypothetical protein